MKAKYILFLLVCLMIVSCTRKSPDIPHNPDTINVPRAQEELLPPIANNLITINVPRTQEKPLPPIASRLAYMSVDGLWLWDNGETRLVDPLQAEGDSDYPPVDLYLFRWQANGRFLYIKTTHDEQRTYQDALWLYDPETDTHTELPLEIQCTGSQPNCRQLAWFDDGRILAALFGWRDAFGWRFFDVANDYAPLGNYPGQGTFASSGGRYVGNRFSLDCEGKNQLLIFDVYQGEAGTEIACTNYYPRFIEWRPNSDVLAFGFADGHSVNRMGDTNGHARLVLVDLQAIPTFNPSDLLPGILPDVYVLDMAWSPDGEVLAVSGIREEEQTAVLYFITNSNDGWQVELIHEAENEDWQWYDHHALMWSPDSQQLIAQLGKQARNVYHLVTREGEVKILTFSDVHHFAWLYWLPDSSALVGIPWLDGQSHPWGGLYWLPVDGRQAQPIIIDLIDPRSSPAVAVEPTTP